MEPIKTHIIKSQVLWSRFISSKIVLFITSLCDLKSIDIDSGEIVLSTNIEDIDLDYTDAIILTPDESILIYPNKNSEYIFFSLKEKKAIKKMEKLEDKPTSCTVDRFARFFCIGFESGHSKVFFYKNLEPFNKPPTHTDTVLFCSFFDYDKLFLTCGLDGKITISNFDNYSAPFRAKLSENKIVGAAHIDDNYMVATTPPDTLIFFDVVDRKIVKRIRVPFHKNLSPMIAKNEKKYLFYLKDGRKVGIIDLKERNILADDLINTNSDITSISLLNEGIIALFLKRGELLIFKLFEAEELKRLILQEEYKKAYELIRKNPLLKNSQEYVTLERIYNDRFSSAFRLFCKQMYKEASEVLAPFAEIPEKRGKIQKLQKEFEHYDQFLEMIKEKNYVKVYSLAQGKEFLPQSPEFILLEKKWIESYKKAQEYILKQADTQSAKVVLKEFYNVPQKRQLIHNLLRNPNLFIELKSAIKNRSFYEFFSLVTKNRFLKGSPEYASVIEYGNRLFETINKKLKNRIFNNILEEIEELEAFPDFKEKLEELKDFSLIATKFLRSYQTKNYPKCFELIDQYPILHGFSEAKELELEWRNEINRAQNFALKGDIVGVQTVLFKYLNINTRIPAIGIILKRAYISQLKKALINGKRDGAMWERAIKRFLSIFGYDDELEMVIKRVKEQGIEVLISKNQETKVEPSRWYTHTKGNLPLDIFE